MKKYKKVTALMLSCLIATSFSGCSYVDIIKDNLISDSVVDDNKEESSLEENNFVEEETTRPFVYEEKYVCSTSRLKLRHDADINSPMLTVIDAFEPLKVIKSNGLWHYVSYGENEGYISAEYTKDLTDTFVEVDISDQKLYLYKDDSIIHENDVVTGLKGKYDTRLGCNPIYSHEHNPNKRKNLKSNTPGDTYSVYVDFWMPFDGGIGLHDSDDWRKDNYGGSIYETNGSHGCVSMSYSDAEFVYNNTKVGDLVLVHN